MHFASFIALITTLGVVSCIPGGLPSGRGPSSSAKPLGINCRGSFFCGWTRHDGPVIEAFYSAIVLGSQANMLGGPVLNNTVYYAGGDPFDIACIKSKSICLFLEGNVPVTGVNGSTIKKRLGELRDHGCRVCGSVPLSGDNNPRRMGILVANFVTRGACDGVCTRRP